jgi:hypothetical protein
MADRVAFPAGFLVFVDMAAAAIRIYTHEIILSYLVANLLDVVVEDCRGSS